MKPHTGTLRLLMVGNLLSSYHISFCYMYLYWENPLMGRKIDIELTYNDHK